MGQTLPGKCIFILKDKASEGSHMGEGVPGILGMNIISELKELLLPVEGTRRINYHGHPEKNTVLSRYAVVSSDFKLFIRRYVVLMELCVLMVVRPLSLRVESVEIISPNRCYSLQAFPRSLSDLAHGVVSKCVTGCFAGPTLYMNPLNQTVGSAFILLAFPVTSELQIFLFVVLLLLYSLTLVGNVLIISVIWFHHRLHTAMYFFLSNLSFLDILFTSVISPTMLVSLLSDRKTISITACLAQTFFFIFLCTVEFVLLKVMSFKRYVAIFKPLCYTVIMNGRVCSRLLLSCWMVASLSMLGPTIVYTRLPFCSQELDHLFGLINPLRKASCVDTSYLKMLDFILSSIVSWSSLTLTIESYTHIIATLLRIPSVQGPKKAFSTCVSHLTVVTLAYESSIFLHVRPQHNQSLASEKGASLLTEVVIPLLNPFIYSLRNDRVKEVLRDAIVRLMGCSKKVSP
ncbi:olfactory receptor 6M1-like [Caretta caretta]|uniref:olfactory receptor 6M1-like n=1 Tax=Caretta caretta TaxID=8467 RepID=UPI003F4B09CC